MLRQPENKSCKWLRCPGLIEKGNLYAISSPPLPSHKLPEHLSI